MKAVFKNGAICPQEPVPEEWAEGTELRVEALIPEGKDSRDELDQWMASVEASADEVDPDDEAILAKTIRELRQQARALALKEAEMP